MYTRPGASPGMILGQTHHDKLGKPAISIGTVEVTLVLVELLQKQSCVIGVSHIARTISGSVVAKETRGSRPRVAIALRKAYEHLVVSPVLFNDVDDRA